MRDLFATVLVADVVGVVVTFFAAGDGATDGAARGLEVAAGFDFGVEGRLLSDELEDDESPPPPTPRPFA